MSASTSCNVPAMPKSVSAGSEYVVTRTLDGLMSRCRMPERCAVSMALASLMPVATASLTDIGLTCTRWPRSGGGQ